MTMVNLIYMDPKSQNNRGIFQLLQKWMFPKGIIDPIMLASTSVVAKGDLYYSDGSKFIRLAPGSAGQVLTMVNGVPTWAAPSSYSGTIAIAKLTGVGADGSITVMNGIITSVTPAT